MSDIPSHIAEEAAQAALAAASAHLHANDYPDVGDALGETILPYIIESLWNRTGAFRIIFFEDMLFPSAWERFAGLEPEIFVMLQAAASKALVDPKIEMTPTLKKHLQMIVSGKVPFGWRVIEGSGS